MENTKRVKRRGVCPTYIGEGATEHEGCGQPLPLFPLHGGGNPLLHEKVTPLIK
jgi:hypothetical protein